ncbi:MAG: aldolase/citrate lyase family protein [Pseudomonadota bacterium]
MTSLRARAMAGEPVHGAFMVEFLTPGLPRILANAGCEFALYDMEHTGASFETLKMLVAAGQGLPMAPMCRVPRGRYHFLARALDIGMHGVMVPMVESEDEARAIAEAVRYPPAGRRGAAFGFAHDGFSPGDPAAKAAEADARTLLIAQIETERGLENVEAIAAVPGIDVLWVGHFDLTNFLGVPGNFEGEVYVNALRRIAAAAKTHGKGLGILGGDAAWLERHRAMGFNMLAAGVDPALLIQGLNGILDPMRSPS